MQSPSIRMMYGTRQKRQEARSWSNQLPYLLLPKDDNDKDNKSCLWNNAHWFTENTKIITMATTRCVMRNRHHRRHHKTPSPTPPPPTEWGSRCFPCTNQDFYSYLFVYRNAKKLGTIMQTWSYSWKKKNKLMSNQNGDSCKWIDTYRTAVQKGGEKKNRQPRQLPKCSQPQSWMVI